MNIWRLVIEVYKEKVVEGQRVRVQAISESMFPLIRVGDFVQIESCGHYKKNDIVAIGGDDGITIHRIRKVQTNGVITSGDQVGYDYKPHSLDSIVGRVVVVESKGHNLRLNSFFGRFVSMKSILIGYLFRFLRHLKFILAGMVAYSGKVKLLGWAYRMVAYLYLKAFVFVLCRNRSIHAVYVRNSFIRGDWIPGVSDIDLTLVISVLDYKQELNILRWIRNIRRLFLLNTVSFVDTEVMAIGELQGSEMAPWKRIYGKSLVLAAVGVKDSFGIKDYRGLFAFYEKIANGCGYLFFIFHYLKKVRRLGRLISSEDFDEIGNQCDFIAAKAVFMSWRTRRKVIADLHLLVVQLIDKNKKLIPFDNLSTDTSVVEMLQTLRFYYVSDATELYTYPYHEAMERCRLENVDYKQIQGTTDFSKLLYCLKIFVIHHC